MVWERYIWPKIYRLGRKVAVKFLSAEKASNPESRKRFIHEARAQAIVSHSNIATFYEVAEERDKVFIVMEYIEGQTLSQLPKTEKLSLPEILDLAIQVGEGLQAAHEKGVMHRDINPNNILLTSKRVVKITDFGLAKWKGASTITHTGLQMGTDSYMSPEQLDGRRTDFRTDIFSLGVVLYEMICACLPFDGANREALFYEILYTQPKPLARYCRNAPEGLERVILKCLAKKPGERYQSAADLVADLRMQKRFIETPSLAQIKESASQRKMIAVLPFDNLGPIEHEYFADGITDEIITKLAKVSSLGVISRTSVMQYKKIPKSIRQIGEELRVQYILEGTIRWQSFSEEESQVRISSQLIRVKDDSHLWAEQYDALLANVFELQSDIAAKVISALKVTLFESEWNALKVQPTKNLEAYNHYLRGNDYFNRSWGKKNLEIAIQIYQKAVELDREFALAYAMLSRAHAALFWFFWDRSEERLSKAKKAIDMALQINPELPEVHVAAGYYYYWGSLDYKRARAELAVAQESQPNNSELLHLIASVQRRQGEWEQALINFGKATELDPSTHDRALQIGITFHHMRHYAEAEQWYERAIVLAPDWSYPYIYKAQLCLNWEGNLQKTQTVLQEMFEKIGLNETLGHNESNWPNILILLNISQDEYLKILDQLSSGISRRDNSGYFLFKARFSRMINKPHMAYENFGTAQKVLERKVKERPTEAEFHARLGVAYAGLGRKDEAIREGKRAVELLPVSKDAIGGAEIVENLAEIYVMVDEYNFAIDQIEYLLTIPSLVSIPYLRAHPIWVPLRTLPRFQKFLAEK